MKNRINEIAHFYNNKLTLSTDRIYVFLINFNLFDSNDFIELLSNNEIERAGKMKSSEKEHQFIIARGIIKKILANA